MLQITIGNEVKGFDIFNGTSLFITNIQLGSMQGFIPSPLYAKRLIAEGRAKAKYELIGYNYIVH